MIYNRSTKAIKSALAAKRLRFIAEETVGGGTNLNPLLDQYDASANAETQCTCADDGVHGSPRSFMAFPSDSTKMLVCCVPCGAIHQVGQ